MRAVLAPRSLVVICAGRKRCSVGTMVPRRIIDAGLDGTVHVVHPSAATIGGLSCHQRVADLPASVDLAGLGVTVELDRLGLGASTALSVGDALRDVARRMAWLATRLPELAEAETNHCSPGRTGTPRSTCGSAWHQPLSPTPGCAACPHER